MSFEVFRRDTEVLSGFASRSTPLSARILRALADNLDWPSRL